MFFQSENLSYITHFFLFWNVKIQTVLSPTQKNVQDLTDQMNDFAQRLGQLRQKADKNRLWATDAQQKAVEVNEKASRTQQVWTWPVLSTAVVSL